MLEATIQQKTKPISPTSTGGVFIHPSPQKTMDLSKENWYNGAICTAVLAATAPTDAKAKECKKDFEDALNNLFEVVKAEVIKEAAFFLESEPKVFNAWYRKNINSKMKRID